MSSAPANEESRPVYSHPSKAHENAPSTSGRSHHSPSSSPALSGFRTSGHENLPPLDLRSSEPGRYVSTVTGHSSLPQYYVAVERPQFKLGTLKDLFEVLARRGEVALGVCCGTRDVLDALVGAISYENRFSIQCLHSDMMESDRSKTLAAFHARKQSSSDPVESPPAKIPRLESSPLGGDKNQEPAQNEEEQTEKKPSINILAMTDACLPMAALGESPLLAKLLINYELPLKKEQYSRRVAAVLGPAAAGALPKITPAGSSPPRPFQSGATNPSSGIVLSFVAAAEVGMLRSLEESLGFIIEEMPINILELL